MNVNNVSLEVVSGNKSQFPKTDFVEIAFAGKSNVGKSSLLNVLINRKALARTSSHPGKTQTINFYNVEDKLYLVDLPGYGYAKKSKTQREKWSTLIETYLKDRYELKLIVLLIDIRHDPSENDKMMYKWIKYFDLKTLIVATKSDKISRSQVNRSIANIRKQLLVTTDDKVIPFSSVTKQGKEEIWEEISNYIFEENESGEVNE